MPLGRRSQGRGKGFEARKIKKGSRFQEEDKEEISGEEGSSPVVHRGRNNQNLLKTLFFKSGAFFQVSETDRPLVKV